MRKISWRWIAPVVLALFFLGASEGGSAERKWDVINTAELKAAMDKGEDLTLVCTLPQIIYDLRHIKGSIGIPLGKIKSSPDMPANKEKLIVFYCLGPA